MSPQFLKGGGSNKASSYRSQNPSGEQEKIAKISSLLAANMVDEATRAISTLRSQDMRNYYRLNFHTLLAR